MSSHLKFYQKTGAVTIQVAREIPYIKFACWISVFLPISILKYKMPFGKNAIMILTRGELRGGILVALALSLPNDYFGKMFVSITYIIVSFSIVVQGLTIGRVAKHFL